MTNNIHIRLYQAQDCKHCIRIFESNQPKFFSAHEKPEFIEFLNNEHSDPYYVMELNNTIIGCGGIYFVQETLKAGLAWGMIDSAFHNQGLGKQFTTFRIEQLDLHYPTLTHTIETSQHTEGFYTKYGFQTVNIMKDCFAPGIHKYTMQRESNIK